LLVLTALAGEGRADPKRVLLLNPFEREVTPFDALVSGFRSTLTQEMGEPVDFFEIPLDLVRFGAADGEAPLVDFMEGRLTSRPVDLVVAVGAAGVRFAGRHRARLFPDTPALVLGADARFVPPELLETNTTFLSQRISLPGMVEDILQLQPETTTIAVVFGSSELEKAWIQQCRREFQPFAGRVQFIWLDDLPLSKVLERCAALPPRSFILHGLYLVDAEGVPYGRGEVLPRLHEAANAPLFALFESEFGLGPIGGHLYRDRDVGMQGARTAIRILRGESPRSIPATVLESAAPVYDWRELQRWGISEARLPAGNIIEFRERGFWERFGWPIAGGGAFLIAQAALIAGLLVNRKSRLRAEMEATLIADISSRFVNLAPGEVDTEINNAQRRICETMGIDLASFWQWTEVDGGVFLLTHAYSLEAGPQTAGRMTHEDFPWSVRELLEGRIVKMASLDRVPVGAERDQEVARKFGIKASLCLPLRLGGGQPLGVFCVNCTRAERVWSDDLVMRMQQVAAIFTHALARKQADQALRESEEVNRATFEHAAVGIAHVAADGRLLRVNDKFCSIVGYTREELVQLTFQDITYPDDLAPDLRLVREVLAGSRESYAMEKRYRRKDGALVWVDLTVSLVRTASGEPRHFISVVEDITERKRADERVRQLSLAVEQSPVSVVITDLSGAIIYVNRKFTDVSGYSAAECLGQNPRILKSGACAPSLYQDLWQRITRGETWRGEFHNRRKNGELYWEWAVISPLLDAAGRVTHFVGVKEDITERKHVEESLRTSEARLAAGADLAELGYYEIDYGARTAFLDERTRKLFGIPSALQTGFESVQFWFEHVHSEDRAHIEDERRKFHAGEVDSISSVYRYSHPEKGQRWLQHSARLAGRSAGGAGLHTFGVLRDVTELKEAEETARALSGRLLRSQEAERARIAKELHDGLSQNLALLSVELDIFGQRLPEDGAQIHARLEEFSRQTKELSAEVHRISHGLHPAKLTQLGLVVALKGYCREVESAHGLTVRLEAREVPRELPEDVALCLYRVAQEAIQNVVKHSGAELVQVTLVSAGDTLELALVDDGRGFEAGARQLTGSLGLVSMHERVRLVHGGIAVQSQPGGGTRIVVTVPFAKSTQP
jgi:PAS domain S-box-containing protein